MQRESRQRLRKRSPRHSRLWDHYALIYDANDLVAGVLFVVGSVLFFWDRLHHSATWCFLVGSILFTVRPLIHVMRDLHLTRLPTQRSGDGTQPSAHVGRQVVHREQRNA